MYRKKNNVIKVMIDRAGHKEGCVKGTVEQIPGRNVTYREKETPAKV